jgi:hypothetical protein
MMSIVDVIVKVVAGDVSRLVKVKVVQRGDEQRLVVFYSSVLQYPYIHKCTYSKEPSIEIQDAKIRGCGVMPSLKQSSSKKL